MAVHCFAHLDQDVGDALPYVNAVLGGRSYSKDPPSVGFKIHGKLITIHSTKIAVNALKDEKEARKIIEWLKNEINTAWENRDKITPLYEAAPQPQVAEGVKGPESCPPLDKENNNKLAEYLGRFRFEF